MGQTGGITAFEEIVVKFIRISLNKADEFTVPDGISTGKAPDCPTGVKFPIQLLVVIYNLNHSQGFHGDHHPSSWIFGHYLLKAYLTSAILDLIVQDKRDHESEAMLAHILYQLLIPWFENPKRDILTREKKHP
jgi:hypothetical protein